MISSPSRSVPEGFLAKRARLRRIAGLFDCPLPTRGYIVGKLATDPAYAAVFEKFGSSDRPIIDIGCGLGLLAHYLRGRGSRIPVFGYDFDEQKIRKARAAASRGGLTDTHFEVGDVADLPPRAANLVLLDVIHYLAPAARRKLLETLANRVGNGDAVLIRATLRDKSWRYRITLAQECWTRWSGWIPSPAPIEFPTAAEILAPFESAGCACEMQPLWGRTPFNSYLLVAG